MVLGEGLKGLRQLVILHGLQFDHAVALVDDQLNAFLHVLEAHRFETRDIGAGGNLLDVHLPPRFGRSVFGFRSCTHEA